MWMGYRDCRSRRLRKFTKTQVTRQWGALARLPSLVPSLHQSLAWPPYSLVFWGEVNSTATVNAGRADQVWTTTHRPTLYCIYFLSWVTYFPDSTFKIPTFTYFSRELNTFLSRVRRSNMSKLVPTSVGCFTANFWYTTCRTLEVIFKQTLHAILVQYVHIVYSGPWIIADHKPSVLSKVSQ